MRGVNYMVFSPESMAEIVEAYVKEKYNWNEVKVEHVIQKKHHNARMFEAKLTIGNNEENFTNEA